MDIHIPVLAASAVRVLEERLWGHSQEVLMSVIEKVGDKLAQAIVEDFSIYQPWPKASRIIVLCGKGHNTADALYAIRKIVQDFPLTRITLLWFLQLDKTDSILSHIYNILTSMEVIEAEYQVLSILEQNFWDKVFQKRFDMTLDGVFGFNFRSPMPIHIVEALKVINTHVYSGLRVAVDVPSGLHEGVVEYAFQADFTYQTGFLKTVGLMRQYACWLGRMRFLNLNFYDQDTLLGLNISSLWGIDSTALIHLSLLKKANVSKYDSGVVAIIAGSLTYSGAALLAVRGAIYSGVGLVHAFVPENLIYTFAAEYPEVIWHKLPIVADSIDGVSLLQQLMALKELKTVVIGPGLTGYTSLNENLWLIGEKLSQPIIWDAACLTLSLLPILLMRKSLGFISIVTPHEGELKKLMGDMDPDHYESLKLFSKDYGLIICLKGYLTRVIIESSIYFILAGNPILARGGSGDILAGLLGGVVATEYENEGEILNLVCRGVLWHARASDLWAREEGERAVSLNHFFKYFSLALR